MKLSFACILRTKRDLGYSINKSTQSSALSTSLRHRHMWNDHPVDPVKDLADGVAGDRQAVILQADHRLRWVGRLAHQLGNFGRQLVGAAWVVDLGRSDWVAPPGVDMHDRADFGMLAVDQKVFDRIYRDAARLDAWRHAQAHEQPLGLVAGHQQNVAADRVQLALVNARGRHPEATGMVQRAGAQVAIAQPADAVEP